jgi:hypothetical protein
MYFEEEEKKKRGRRKTFSNRHHRGKFRSPLTTIRDFAPSGCKYSFSSPRGSIFLFVAETVA